MTLLELFHAPIRLLAQLMTGGRVAKGEWQHAADSLGMKFRSGLRSRIMGSRRGFVVSIEAEVDDFSIVVEGKDRIPHDLELTAETAFSRAFRADITIGDQAIDLLARIGGSEATVVALLDSQTRKQASDAIRLGTTVKSGCIFGRAGSLRQLPDIVDSLIDLGERLTLRRQEIPIRLAKNALTDPYSEHLRLRNLELLFEHYPRHETATETARAVLTSSDRSLRLAGALFLGDEGLPTLCEIARTEPRGDRIRLDAITALTRTSWAERAIPVLEEILDSKAALVRRKAIVALGNLRHAAAVPRLRAMISTESRPTVKAIADALGRIGSSEAEADLIALLDHTDQTLIKAAARALGRLGTATAVEPLLLLTKRGQPESIRRAARNAIDRIQKRLKGAEHGQLSVINTTDQVGALSSADETLQDGNVSLLSDDKN